MLAKNKELYEKNLLPSRVLFGFRMQLENEGR
jgi:hypothetical protein